MRIEPANDSIVELAPETRAIGRGRPLSAPDGAEDSETHALTPPRPASAKAGVGEGGLGFIAPAGGDDSLARRRMRHFRQPSGKSIDVAEARARSSAEGSEKNGSQDELVYADRIGPGFRRRKTAKGFAFFDLDDLRIRSPSVLRRIDALAIPPAYVDVWICPTANGHIQATGRDARGRLQYRYHQRWGEIANLAKFDHLVEFARILPRLREKVAIDLQLRGLPRQKVLASIVRLLETTLIRVGNDEYARANKSYGLTTLRNRHLRIDGWTLRFEFKGKSGRTWKLALTDRRVARVLRGCQDLPGQRLFQYVDEEGRLQSITSSDVNAHLRELSGRDITAKDFRTWSGTLHAAIALAGLPPVRSVSEAKGNLRAIVAEVAKQLGNTPAICRKSYIHPEIVSAYLAGDLILKRRPKSTKEAGNPESDERRVLQFLKRREAAAAQVQPAPARPALDELATPLS